MPFVLIIIINVVIIEVSCESCYLKLSGILAEICEDVMNEREGSLVDSEKFVC